MIKYLSIPFIAYFLLMPYAALVGRDAAGPILFDEWIIISQVLFFGYTIRQIKKRTENATD